jgi:GDP-mannose 6-dehydrogenase
LESPTTVAVLGLGYVGCVSAACLASLGHRVVGVDRDTHKVQSVIDGVAPFFEPGLDVIVRDAVAAGRLTATTSLAEGLREASIALICVGTPSDRNGNLSLEQLRRVSEEIAALVAERKQPLIVAIRSTVWPGTSEELYNSVFHNSPLVKMVGNPEFLREGTAVRDFLEPSLLVVGGDDGDSVRRVTALYAGLPGEACIVALRTAETIKYTCNAFHALKIAFANEVGALCDRLDIPANQVMDTLCQDVKLNISKAYLKPGFAFGGSCLPKDLRALTYRAARLDLGLPLLGSILPSNEEHLRRATRAVLDLPARKIGVYGLTFKEDTDDVRESPVVTLLEQIIGKGRDVRVFDPHLVLDKIYGSNQDFLLAAIPHIGKLLCRDLAAVLEHAECLLLTQRPSAPERALIERSQVPILDLTGWRLLAKSPAEPVA